MTKDLVETQRVYLTIFTAAIFLTAFAIEAHAVSAQVGPFGGLRAPAVGGIAGWILAKQALFYRALSRVIRLAKSDGSALWGLMGISFIYGIFHAAGPGHGKAVISSYLVANEETWRRGLVLSFASALLQALTAVAIVAVAAVLLGATAALMGQTVRVIEIVSYGLIVLLGARLLWVKGWGFCSALHTLRTRRDASTDTTSEYHEAPSHHHNQDYVHDLIKDPPRADYDAHHVHGCAHGHGHGGHHHHDVGPQVLPWGHAHGPEPQELAGPGGWWRGISAVVAVGLRPCSGAIIVLVFALTQGLLWAGIASTFVMGLGTAITVAAMATLAVSTKALARRFARGRISSYGSVLVRGLEMGAAASVLIFGILLLTGYMVSERMGVF